MFARLGTFGPTLPPKERNAPPSLPHFLVSFRPSFLPSFRHRQFDAIVGFVSAACSIPMARPQRSSGISRPNAFCSVVFCGARITFHFRRLHDSPPLCLSLSRSSFRRRPSVHPSFIIFFLIFVSKFLVVSTEMVQRVRSRRSLAEESD